MRVNNGREENAIPMEEVSLNSREIETARASFTSAVSLAIRESTVRRVRKYDH